MKCEGYRRYGGAFTLGPVKWVQCKEEATVTLEVVQSGKKQSMPACHTCWQEAISMNMEIVSASPIISSKGETDE